MKRGMAGGAHRGPIAPGRQRRTIRMMQALLVATATALLLFAGYSWGLIASAADAREADELDAPRTPSVAQVVVPAILGLGCLAAALSLQAGSGVRLPTPARLDQMRAAPARPPEGSRRGGDPGAEERPPANS